MEDLNIKTLLDQIQTSLTDTKSCANEITNIKNEKLKEKMKKFVGFLQKIIKVVDKCKGRVDHPQLIHIDIAKNHEELCEDRPPKG